MVRAEVANQHTVAQSQQEMLHSGDGKSNTVLEIHLPLTIKSDRNAEQQAQKTVSM